MNKKGAKGEIAVVIGVFITVLVGLILLPSVAQYVGQTTDTVAIANSSFAAANATNYYLAGYKSCSSVVIYNNTADVVIGSGNYTVTNNVVHNGAEKVRIYTQYNSAVYAGNGWNISCTAQPDTYIGEGAGRSVAPLITIFFALAILVVVFYIIGRQRFW